MKPHSKKTQIKVAIATFFGMLKPGDLIKSEEIVKACKRHMGIKYIYADTVLRYCREMRQDSEINFTVLCKCERRYKVLESGEPHSV